MAFKFVDFGAFFTKGKEGKGGKRGEEREGMGRGRRGKGKRGEGMDDPQILSWLPACRGWWPVTVCHFANCRKKAKLKQTVQESLALAIMARDDSPASSTASSTAPANSMAANAR